MRATDVMKNVVPAGGRAERCGLEANNGAGTTRFGVRCPESIELQEDLKLRPLSGSAATGLLRETAMG
jgi:hypothetical protein